MHRSPVDRRNMTMQGNMNPLKLYNTLNSKYRYIIRWQLAMHDGDIQRETNVRGA
jgi:hypothetical protein